MSMTQVAFLRKADLPTNKQLQERIQNLGYQFEILDDSENSIGNDGLECIINGHKTSFETYLKNAIEIVNEEHWIKPGLTNQDAAISFIWGADYAAGACIGLISIALIDSSQALIYYMDDQLNYTREMLVADTPQFLKELEKQNIKHQSKQKTSTLDSTKNIQPSKSIWERVKNIFK